MDAYERAGVERAAGQQVAGRLAMVVDGLMIDSAQLRIERRRRAIARAAGLLGD